VKHFISALLCIGSAASLAAQTIDPHLVIARLQFLEFKAHRCDLGMLRATFARHATPHQRRTIVERIEFAFLGDTGRELTPR